MKKVIYLTINKNSISTVGITLKRMGIEGAELKFHPLVPFVLCYRMMVTREQAYELLDLANEIGETLLKEE